jgi:hypothetical protein
MTPKQVARSLVKYGKKYPEIDMTAFIIPQVPGSVPRSHSVDGVAESLLKSKKYLLPLTVIAPEVTGGVVLAYLVDGRLKLPKEATVFNIGDQENGGQMDTGLPVTPAIAPSLGPSPTTPDPANHSSLPATPQLP